MRCAIIEAMIKPLLIFVIAGIYIVLMSKFMNIYVADVYYTASKGDMENGLLKDAEKNINKAISLNVKEPAYYRQRAKVMLGTLILAEDAEETKLVAQKDLETAQKLNVKNLATLRNSIPLYYFLAIGDISDIVSDQNIDEKYLPVTRNYYDLLKDTYGNDLGVLADVAKYEKKLGLGREYEQSWQRAYELRPDITNWHESFRR